jgi:hypothetical protein
VAFCEAMDAGAMQSALNHLIAILFRASRGLFLIEEGVTRYSAKYGFFEGWLLEKLLPYFTAGTFREAAQRGRFRYLGNQGRCALIDELRKRNRDALNRKPVRMDKVIDIAAKGYAVTLHDLIGVGYEQNAVCLLGKKPCLEPSALRLELEHLRGELINKLGESLFGTLSSILALFPDQLSPGDITRQIAKSHGVSEPTARKIRHQLCAKLRGVKGDPVVCSLVRMIGHAGDPISLITDTWEPISQDSFS